MKFYKMNGLGNSFYVFDLRSQKEQGFQELHSLTKQDYDQLVVILDDNSEADCFMKIYNIDGSRAEACGNATRCVARLLGREEALIRTINRDLLAYKIADNYQVNMGRAKTESQDIPLSEDIDANNILLLDENKFGKGSCVNVGNPHIVFFVENIDEVNLEEEVSHLERHELFSEGININIAQIISNSQIRAKTWERGAGATLACGTGACATFYAAYKRGLVEGEAELSLPGGSLNIAINEADEILMTGDANLEAVLES